MQLGAIAGVIERRILANYRVDAQAMARALPAPFRPQLVDGHAIAGVCLIKLGQVRPALSPAEVGLGFENAAHRVAVCWDTPTGERTGVYVLRRDTDSKLASLAGGRIFSGIHHLASFDVATAQSEVRVHMQSADNQVEMLVAGRLGEAFPNTSVFQDLESASAFFEQGSLGYSELPQAGCFEGLELRCEGWACKNLAVSEIRSSFFDDAERFPTGSICFDHALYMENIQHEWHSAGVMKTTPAVG